ncbi:MAG: hypothetical protein IJZ46_00855 [Bacilli bacterium]|nr:hypothetical protein [Bacilli bacterium]
MYKENKIFVLGMARSGYEVVKLLAFDNEVFIELGYKYIYKSYIISDM